MDPRTVRQLIELNQRFYAAFGAEFAATRRRIQDGVRSVLDGLPDEPGARWLDIGCGSGALAVEWLARRRQSSYQGVDFSAELLAEARAAVRAAVHEEPRPMQVSFALADLSTPAWADGLPGRYAGVLAFAVLHHLPSQALRESILRRVHDLIVTGGCLIHSEWQFQHSPKLLARRVPWSTVGLSEEALEPGDTLLDWRSRQAGQGGSTDSLGQVGLRYVHLFSREELAGLTAGAGFRLLREFESDGQGGRLGLYQVWQRQ